MVSPYYSQERETESFAIKSYSNNSGDLKGNPVKIRDSTRCCESHIKVSYISH